MGDVQGHLVFHFLPRFEPPGPVGACFAAYTPKCDLHSNRTGSVTESIKPANFLKLNHPGVMCERDSKFMGRVV